MSNETNIDMSGFGEMQRPKIFSGKRPKVDRKYKLLRDDNIKLWGKTLYRICALRAFNDVKAGDLGGYIESVHNLSYEGNCWVYDEGKVLDLAVVAHNAQVKNHAKVSGQAWVLDDSRILDNAHVHERAEVYGYAVINKNQEICGKRKVCKPSFVA